MQSERSGKELYEEWKRLNKSGELGASQLFTQSLMQEERMRLFEYDAQLQQEREAKELPHLKE